MRAPLGIVLLSVILASGCFDVGCKPYPPATGSWLQHGVYLAFPDNGTAGKFRMTVPALDPGFDVMPVHFAQDWVGNFSITAVSWKIGAGPDEGQPTRVLEQLGASPDGVIKGLFSQQTDRTTVQHHFTNFVLVLSDHNESSVVAWADEFTRGFTGVGGAARYQLSIPGPWNITKQINDDFRLGMETGDNAPDREVAHRLFTRGGWHYSIQLETKMLQHGEPRNRTTILADVAHGIRFSVDTAPLLAESELRAVANDTFEQLGLSRPSFEHWRYETSRICAD